MSEEHYSIRAAKLATEELQQRKASGKPFDTVFISGEMSLPLHSPSLEYVSRKPMIISGNKISAREIAEACGYSIRVWKSLSEVWVHGTEMSLAARYQQLEDSSFELVEVLPMPYLRPGYEVQYYVSGGYGTYVNSEGKLERLSEGNDLSYPDLAASAKAARKYMIANLDAAHLHIYFEDQYGRLFSQAGITDHRTVWAGDKVKEYFEDLFWRRGDAIRVRNTGELYIVDDFVKPRIGGTTGVDCHKAGSDEAPGTWNLPVHNVTRVPDLCVDSPVRDLPPEPDDMYATINWEDGRIRLYCDDRLEKDDFKAMMDQGFQYVRGEPIFYAPYSAWREKFLMTHFGIRELQDDDTDLDSIAQERAERYEGFSGNAAKRSQDAKKVADHVANAVPFGQPILVGHHSEKRDRKFRERGWNKFGEYIKENERAQYWQSRAEVALANRASKLELHKIVNRIDRLEADLRSYQRELAKSGGESWSYERLVWFVENRLMYEKALLESMPKEKQPISKAVIEKDGAFKRGPYWYLIDKVNKKNIVYYSHGCRLNYPIAAITEQKYMTPDETKAALKAEGTKISSGGYFSLKEGE